MTDLTFGYTLIHETDKAWGMWDRKTYDRGKGGKKLAWVPKSKYDCWRYHNAPVGSDYDRYVLVGKSSSAA